MFHSSQPDWRHHPIPVTTVSARKFCNRNMVTNKTPTDNVLPQSSALSPVLPATIPCDYDTIHHFRQDGTRFTQQIPEAQTRWDTAGECCYLVNGLHVSENQLSWLFRDIHQLFRQIVTCNLHLSNIFPTQKNAKTRSKLSALTFQAMKALICIITFRWVW
jgi:hypothetical protein